LLRIAAEAVKEGFKTATMLREAGMTVELALEGQQTAECGWLLEVKAESPVFVVTDKANGSKSAVDSVKEVLDLLGCN
jgi:hypothetical protein